MSLVIGKTMDFNILECNHFIAKVNGETPKRIIRNYEFDLYMNVDKKINIDAQMYNISNNCLCLKKPGQIAYSIGDFDCYTLTVDFSGKTQIENYKRDTAMHTEELTNDPLIKHIPTILYPQHSADLKLLFSNLTKQIDLRSDISHSLFEEIIYIINADIKHAYIQENKPKKDIFDSVIKYITANYNKQITLDDLANHINFTKSYLIRAFKNRFKMTPIDYLIKYRLNHAANLLANTTMSIAEISFSCGYNNTAFFISQFKKHFGITPLQYRLQTSVH